MDPKSLPRILYIEDTPEARQLVRRLLAQDYIVLEAKDALHGIELALDTHPDLVLLDINLPELSGREVATRLRSLLPQTPLVALTADISPGARERALAAGCVGYISKPIQVDAFVGQVEAYLHGKRETLSDSAHYARVYQDELVERLEAKVRELTRVAERNSYLNEQNQRIIGMLQRRQRLLEGAARVGHSITSILDLDTLLAATVDIICEEYGFYYAGIFLLEADPGWVRLRAGRGQAGAKMLADGFGLPMDGDSLVGDAIRQRQASIVHNVARELAIDHNPYLPDTRAEVALPLAVKERVLGALTVHSDHPEAFEEDDITALQALADTVAIAIQNAQLLRDLEFANHELLRTKTFEAIATATGEAVHWVGNKAAPIPASIQRVRSDLMDLLVMVQALLAVESDQRQMHPFWAVVQSSLAAAQTQGYDLEERLQALLGKSPRQVQLLGGLESILEDLQIIAESADTILTIKEDLIGPARLAAPQAIWLHEFLPQIVAAMGLPDGVVQVNCAAPLPPVQGDSRQLGNVFNNLIKNAWEALEGNPDPHIQINLQAALQPGFIQVEVQDNGPGIPPDIMDKIWVSFFTTKGQRGGTGLGLFSCMEIVHQAGGKIWVESQLGQGACFIVVLPLAKKSES
ncbi:MAG: response regulator [Anaerolineales bacterium]|nr:response regulator [Anaerolineales bacterium]